MTYPGGNAALLRHWQYFLRSGADEIEIVMTNDDTHEWLPKGINGVKIGRDSYISGRHLPQRLVDTVNTGLNNKTKFQHILVAEYDCLFAKRIRYEAMEHGMAGYRAGSQTWGSKAKSFYHPPYLFKREAAEKFVSVAQEEINSGVCDRERGQPDPPEASPDVFVGLISEKYNIPIQDGLWDEYSRNSFDLPGHLDEARAAYKNGIDVLHGVKSSFELEFITS